MKNIEIFEAISGLLLADLYQHFPIKMKVQPAEYSMRLEDEHWSECVVGEKYVRHHSPAAIVEPAIEWLANAGYISYDAYDGEYFDGVTLTAKGLEVIRSDKNLAEKLVSAAKDIAKSESKEIARENLRKLMSYFLEKGIKYGGVFLG
ncbi:MAG: hypothetical protein KME67_08925 [Candidatus Thiodiazotropha sp. (ex Codakia orbicularis)]|nr:hypothetical protein [Candidatus Thiodiazotropha sp. (ex Codakia orbicularis)]